MAFQFKRDRAQNLELILAGDIDLEVTPDIKAQLVSQLEDANGLVIDGKNISYLDSSGVSILVISMQSCKQRQLSFKIVAMSEEAFRVLQLAKLDKILPIENVSGPAQLVNVDAFSGVSGPDDTLAHELAGDTDRADDAAMMGSSDDDLIAALASGNMDTKTPSSEPQAEEAVSLEMTPDPEPAPEAAPAPAPTPPPTATPAPAAEQPQNPEPQSPEPQSSEPQNNGGASGGGGSFTPGTFS